MHLKLTNGQPETYSIGQLRRDNPQISFPKAPSDTLLADYGVFPYTRPSVPEYDSLAWRLIDDDFTQDAQGNWSRGYELEALPLEQAERNIRAQRDSLLSETDWVVVKSYERGENIPAVWELYRQALRDITAQTDFPYSVAWPTKPE